MSFQDLLAGAITNAVQTYAELLSVVNPQDKEVRYVNDLDTFFFYDAQTMEWKPSFATIQPAQGLTGVQGATGVAGLQG